MRVIPVFVVTGFLDSGKTTLVRETLMEQEWIEPGAHAFDLLRRRRDPVHGRIFTGKGYGPGAGDRNGDPYAGLF